MVRCTGSLFAAAPELKQSGDDGYGCSSESRSNIVDVAGILSTYLVVAGIEHGLGNESIKTKSSNIQCNSKKQTVWYVARSMSC